MDHKTYSVMATFGSSIYLALGFVALGSLAIQSSQGYQGYYSETIAQGAWVESIIALLVGFVLLIIGWLFAKGNPGAARTGGILGVLVGIGGTLNAVAMLGLNPSYSNQLTGYISIASVFVMFIGFPLVLASSVGGLVIGQTESSPNV